MFKCPYCGGSAFTAAVSTKVRTEFHSLQQCDSCDGYSVLHTNGRVYPLDDRTDPGGDAVSRVLD